MNYYRFRAEFTDPKTGKTQIRRVSTWSKHLAGAMRKVYQDHEGINVITILN